MVIFPDVVELGAHKYKVLYPYAFRERTDLRGQYDGALLELRISGKDCGGCEVSDTPVLQTFFHELLHAIDNTFCMDQIGKEIDKDRLINGIAEGLTDYLIKNKMPEMRSMIDNG